MALIERYGELWLHRLFRQPDGSKRGAPWRCLGRPNAIHCSASTDKRAGGGRTKLTHEWLPFSEPRDTE